MKFAYVSRELIPRRAFRISRPRKAEVRNVYLRLEHEGATGYGEAAPNAFYDESWQGVIAKLEEARAFIEALDIREVSDVEAAWREGWSILNPSRAAQCALDVALWDWLARRKQTTVAELAWGSAPVPVESFATIGLSTPEELPAKVDELRGFPWIKIKSDASADLETIRYVRDHNPARLAVDANCAWENRDLPSLSRDLADQGVEFLEQPLPPAMDEWITPLAVPVLADESCVTQGDVARVAERFDGFNIKLVKCGGITPARQMVIQGRQLGKKIMVGCMLESSALIAAGAVIAQRTDYADLDGAWLIGNDPFTGWHFDRGTLHPPSDAGLGVAPIPGFFP